MSKTVVMRKGVKFADIFDSAETIAQAQRDGYHLCDADEVDIRADKSGIGEVYKEPVRKAKSKAEPVDMAVDKDFAMAGA